MAIALISGGSGLIGTALSRVLLSRGHRVIVLTRNSLKQPAYGESAVWDGIHPGLWMDWVQKADWVINLAGENIGAKPWTEKRMQLVRESRTFSSELLTEAVFRSPHKPAAFLQMSAVGYYGTQSPADDSHWDESTPPGTDHLATICREWEASSIKVEKLEVRRLIIRTGLVLARNAGVLPKLELPFRLFVGGPMGNGHQIYSWIHLSDLVHGMLAVLENPDARGPYNLTAPEPVTNREFARLIGRVLHRPSWIPVPAFALRLLLGEMSTLILDGQRVVPSRLQKEIGFKFKYPTLEAALQNLHPA
jgi:uncharacterized protein